MTGPKIEIGPLLGEPIGRRPVLPPRGRSKIERKTGGVPTSLNMGTVLRRLGGSFDPPGPKNQEPFDLLPRLEEASSTIFYLLDQKNEDPPPSSSSDPPSPSTALRPMATSSSLLF